MPVQTALVTGSSAGIGRAVARRLAQQGVLVAAVARTASRLHALAAQHPARIVPVPGDLGDLGRTEELRDRVIAAIGLPDAIVHNVGVGQIAPFAATTPADWEPIVRTNLMGTLALTRAFLAGMLERDRGVMLLVGSDAAPGWPYMTLYSATKAALAAAWRSLAREYRETGLRFPLVVVGPTSGTEFARGFDPEHVARATAAWMALGLLAGEAATAEESAARIVAALQRPEHFVP